MLNEKCLDCSYCVKSEKDGHTVYRCDIGVVDDWEIITDTETGTQTIKIVGKRRRVETC